MGTDLALAFDKRFYEIDEVFFVSVSKLNHHPNINQIYDYFLFIFSKKLSVSMKQSVNLSKSNFPDIITDLSEPTIRFLPNLYQNIAAVTICMNKIIFHQHLKESSRS